MLKKSLLLGLMSFGANLSLIAMEEAIIDSNKARVEMIKNEVGHNQYLDSRDQGLKYLAILLPTAVLGATILKVWKGNMSSDGGALAFFGGGLASYFCVIMTEMLSNVQAKRGEANTKLREELTKLREELTKIGASK